MKQVQPNIQVAESMYTHVPQPMQIKQEFIVPPGMKYV